MKLIIGLGNPEEKYTGTRHNIGFAMLDAYAAQKGLVFHSKEKFKASIAETAVGGEKALLVKPTTYYNLSGEAVRALADFYKVGADDILVVHDELALPYGTLRTRIGGSDAGNNGIKSITQHCGSDTRRIRLGVYNELRDRIDDADFVLGKWTREEAERLPELAAKVSSLIDGFIRGDFEPSTHSSA